MKYKLINITTKQETLCDKVTIDGFDYYVSDKEPTLSDTLNTCYYIFKNTLYKRGYSHHTGSKKVIATTNPFIDLPKVVDEVDIIRESLVDSYLKKITDLTRRFFWKAGFKHGYNKSQETHPFSEEDMIEFAEWKGKEKFEWNIRYNNWTSQLVEYSGCVYTTQELLQIWKEQQPKIVYYEQNNVEQKYFMK